MRVSKGPSTAMAGARDLKGRGISPPPRFTSSRNGLAIRLSARPLRGPGDNKLMLRSEEPFISVETSAPFCAPLLLYLSEQTERHVSVTRKQCPSNQGALNA